MINTIDTNDNATGKNIIGSGKNDLFHELTSKSVLPIQKSYEPIKDISQIPELVEAPLISAVEKLFQKKIETMDTSANNGRIWIQIFYDGLDTHNKGVVEKLGGIFSLSGWSGGRPLVRFSLPPIVSTPIQYIQDWGNRIADNFQSQNMRIIKKTWTLKEMAKFRNIQGASEQDVINDIQDLIHARIIKYDPLRKIITTH